MNIFTDLRTVSENAINQLSGRFTDLPRPLLAAIGAGDLAVEQLAKLREQLHDKLGTDRGAPDREDVKAFAADLPGRAQKIASDLAHQLEEFAQAAPEKAQRLIGEMPGKASEFTESLSPENLRSTIEAYTNFVGSIYDTLADRGSETASKMRPEQASDDAASAGATGAARATGAAASGSGSRRSTVKSGTAAKNDAGTSRTRTSRSTSAKPRAAKSATGTSTATKSSTAKSTTAKRSTAKRSTTKRSTTAKGAAPGRTSTTAAGAGSATDDSAQ